MKIRIAYIIDRLRIGGTEKQLVEIANRLDTEQFEPEVFILRKYPQDNLYSSFKCKLRVLNILSFKHVQSWINFFKLISILRKDNFHIVQTFFPESTFLGTIAARCAGIPFVISTRRDMGFWHWMRNRLFLKASNLFVDRVLVNSIAVKNYVHTFENFNNNFIDVIYNGIDATFYENFNHAKSGIDVSLTIGIISNFNRPVKRFDVFLSAMTKIAENFDNINFLIVGDVPHRLRMMVPEHIKNKFILTGSVDDVRKYLTSMDIGVLCSDSEGFPNVILEYMMSGVACVCTRAGGNVEIINNGVDGLLFTAGDYEDLYNKVCILINDVTLRNQLRLNAIKKIRNKYDWCRIMERYQAYYSSLMSDNIIPNLLISPQQD